VEIKQSKAEQRETEAVAAGMRAAVKCCLIRNVSWWMLIDVDSGLNVSHLITHAHTNNPFNKNINKYN